MVNALAVVPGGEAELPMSLQMQQRESLKAAGALAKEVAKIVKDNGLSRTFSKGGREHVSIEGWLTISRVNNEQPHAEVKDVKRDPETGVEVIHARAWITNDKGTIVSEADGYCSTEEGNWNGKPFYARASMAQTRALGKAMRLRHAWVMVMAGFEATPAEEMDGVELEPVRNASRPKPTNAPQSTQKAQEAPQVEARANSSSTVKSEPLVVPDGEQDGNLTCEAVTVIGWAKEPRTGTKKDGSGWWQIGVKVGFPNNRQEWVVCWSEKLFNVLRANKGKTVILTYETGEYNGKPQYTAHDVQEAGNG